MLTASVTYEEELSVPADSDQLERIRNFVGAVAAHCGFNREDRSQIAGAVYDAAANAIANSPRSSRDTVSVRALWRGGRLVFYVRDRGVRRAVEISA